MQSTCAIMVPAMRTKDNITDMWGSKVFSEEQVKKMSDNTLKRHIKRHFRWSQGIGEFDDNGEPTPETHKPMPYSPRTFRLLVMEVVSRLGDSGKKRVIKAKGR